MNLTYKSGPSNVLEISEVHRAPLKVWIQTNHHNHPDFFIIVSNLKRHFEINKVSIFINFIKC